jgi:hypothetical protein
MTKLSARWTDYGTVVEVAFKSAKIQLDDGKFVVTNIRRLKKI